MRNVYNFCYSNNNFALTSPPELETIAPMSSSRAAVLVAGAIVVVSLSADAQVNVLSYRGDLARTGANLSETILTPANVHSSTFGKLYSYSVDGYVYAQPLYVSGLTIPGKGTRNVLFVATEHNSIYAFDADHPVASGGLLWQINLGTPALTPNPDFGNPNGSDLYSEVGITGMPVIDLGSQTMYLDVVIHEGSFYLHL